MDANKNMEICKVVEKQIDQILAKPDMSPNDLENLGELIDIVKDLSEIKRDEEMPMPGMSGSSYGFSVPYWGNFNMEDPRYTKGSSYGRSNMNNNRYVYNNNGSSYGRYDDMDGRMMPGRDW